MKFKRLVAAAFALLFGLALGACSSVADFASDHWPHFAGGEPNGTPPRPGQPGYADFIAHGQPAASTNAPAASAPPAAAGQTAASNGQVPVSGNQQPSAFAEPSPQDQKPAMSLAPAVARPSNDPSVVQGGLY